MFLLISGMCSGLLPIPHFQMSKFVSIPSSSRYSLTYRDSSATAGLPLVHTLRPLQPPEAALKAGVESLTEAPEAVMQALPVEEEPPMAGLGLSRLRTGPPQLHVQILQLRAIPLATEFGKTGSTSSVVVICAWRRSSLATPMILPSSTPVSTSKSTTTFRSRQLALEFLTQFLPSRALLWMQFFWKTSAMPCTQLLPLSKSTLFPSSLVEET